MVETASDTICGSITSLLDEIDNPVLILFPNSTDRLIYVQVPLKRSRKAVFRLYDTQGKLISEYPFQADQIQINLAFLSEGIYVGHIVVDGEHVITRRISIRK